MQSRRKDLKRAIINYSLLIPLVVVAAYIAGWAGMLIHPVFWVLAVLLVLLNLSYCRYLGIYIAELTREPHD